MAGERPVDAAAKKFYKASAGVFLVFLPVHIWLAGWHGGINVAYAVSGIASFVMTAGVVEYARRRPADQTTTWGEAMVGAMYVYTLLFVAYAIWPHHWLVWADSEMNWRPDRLLIGPGGILEFLPFDLTYLVLRDIIAVLIYAIGLAALPAVGNIWQNRGKEASSSELETTTYGRPLQKQKVDA